MNHAWLKRRKRSCCLDITKKLLRNCKFSILHYNQLAQWRKDQNVPNKTSNKQQGKTQKY